MFMLQRMHALQVGGGAEAPYAANAVDFDGTNDYLTKASDLTGAVDASTGILSMWVRFDGGDGVAQRLVHDALSRTSTTKSTGNLLTFGFSGESGENLTFQASSTLTAGATWRHILASWNTAFSAGNKIKHLFINDVSDLGAVSDSSPSFSIDYTPGSWAIGASTAAANKFNGCMAEFYFAPGQFLDFSVEANRRKFISATGKPVDLGLDGSTPTGTAPLVYLNNPAASFGTNKGTGGNFTITGTLDTASTSPSD